MASSNGNGGRPLKVTGVEDDRLANKPTTLLECERMQHDWQDELIDGRKALRVWERDGRNITQVAEVKNCARCGTTRSSIFWYPEFQFIQHKYGDRPEGATPIHVDGAPRLTKADKHVAYFYRQASSMVLVDA